MKNNFLSLVISFLAISFFFSCSKPSLHDLARSGQVEAFQNREKENPVDYKIKDELGRTLLHDAAYYGQLETVHFLLKKEINVNEADNEGISALHLAAECWQFHSSPQQEKKCDETVVALVENGAQINLATKYKWLPIHVAALMGRKNIIKLLGNKNNINVRNDKDFTPLHLAAANAHLGIIEELIQLGADTNAVTEEGFTALHIAARYGEIATAELLIKKGIDVKKTDKQKKTFLDIAMSKGKESFVEYFQK